MPRVLSLIAVAVFIATSATVARSKAVGRCPETGGGVEAEGDGSLGILRSGERVSESFEASKNPDTRERHEDRRARDRFRSCRVGGLRVVQAIRD